jgi:hypothetical protein
MLNSTFIYQKIIIMFHIKITILATCFFFILGCEEKEKSTTEFDDVIQLCNPPSFSGEMCLYNGIEYAPPMFFKGHLDSLIMHGKKSLCYRKGYSGFNIVFDTITNGIGDILVTTNDVIFIGDYSVCKGYFEYKSHYFACFGEVDKYPIDTVRQVKVKIAFPKKYFSEIDDSQLFWTYRYENGDLSLVK